MQYSIKTENELLSVAKCSHDAIIKSAHVLQLMFNTSTICCVSVSFIVLLFVHFDYIKCSDAVRVRTAHTTCTTELTKNSKIKIKCDNKILI